MTIINEILASLNNFGLIGIFVKNIINWINSVNPIIIIILLFIVFLVIMFNNSVITKKSSYRY